MDSLATLSSRLGEALLKHEYMLSLAESCTGGMASSFITEIAGSSAWFDCGFVTYSNAAKQKMLGVSAATIEQYGAVSEQTALEMAMGAINHSQANIAGSITGIAGPSGGTINKPVGTVCFAWIIQSKEAITATHYFTQDRQGNRQQATLTLFNGLLDLINNSRL
ncbi:MAG: CinA family protein [Methylotenera sp.]|jgi:nicotinamide-nucleotide amidase